MAIYKNIVSPLSVNSKGPASRARGKDVDDVGGQQFVWPVSFVTRKELDELCEKSRTLVMSITRPRLALRSIRQIAVWIN